MQVCLCEANLHVNNYILLVHVCSGTNGLIRASSIPELSAILLTWTMYHSADHSVNFLITTYTYMYMYTQISIPQYVFISFLFLYQQTYPHTSTTLTDLLTTSPSVCQDTGLLLQRHSFVRQGSRSGTSMEGLLPSVCMPRPTQPLAL